MMSGAGSMTSSRKRTSRDSPRPASLGATVHLGRLSPGLHSPPRLAWSLCRLGVESSITAAEVVIRQRVAEATNIGDALLCALVQAPQRLFDKTDAELAFMLWGVEKSTKRLQAAVARSAKTLDEIGSLNEEDEEANESKRLNDVLKCGGAMEAAEVSHPARVHPLARTRLLHWGGSTMPDAELNMSHTDSFIGAMRSRRGDV